jgi:ABC-type multidrug transport system ATPase subunit
VASLYSADSICKAFGARTLLKAASIWATEGRITALFGRNGCGKSTLLKIGAGMLPADQGAIHFDGRVYLRPRLPELARLGLFYLPDRNLLSTRITLRQQIQAVEWHFGSEHTSEIIERLELGPRLDLRSHQMSGGERRRSELALAWIRAPRCLLADEPFAGIDPADRELIAEVLKELAGRGCALLISGHEVSHLLAIADDVIWMTAGTTHGLGAPELAVTNDQFQREYLGPSHR